ncbi:CoA transferase [Streptomyces sp. ODS28]|uniref:CoA transferase n=1 Tax=Streptomyces sp. ODS28 TaxID=3136688 RepID=UPI0031E7D98E
MERASAQALTGRDGMSTDRGAAGDRPPGGSAGSGAGTSYAWRALGGQRALLERLHHTYRDGVLPARLPVRELARSTVATCALAAAELAAVRASSSRVAPVTVDDGAVAAAFTSERHLRIDGRETVNFAPLSRFWRTADGWVRTHANYPHHRALLLAALAVPERGEADEVLAHRVAAQLVQRKAEEVEQAVFARGGLAVAVRSREAWDRHPQGVAASSRPLLSVDALDGAEPLPFAPTAGNTLALPLAGVRVLDLTRVTAGPVATRTLALLGADVLRIDPPKYPEFAEAHADTGFGKRSVSLELDSRAGQARFEELLGSAHVVVTAYRPGALDRFGLAPESLADRRPGLVVGQISAWGGYGPWHRRRGFDSLVQAATGIAKAEEDTESGVPGALPAQALDHGSGYLLAAAVMRSLTEQQEGRAGSRVVRLALAQTAHWLLHGHGLPGGRTEAGDAAPAAEPPYDPADWMAECDSPLGRLRHVVSPVRYEGAPERWAHPPGVLGGDAVEWR